MTVAMHLAIAMWLLFNVMFNHAMCAFTSPGTTLDVDPQVSVITMAC